MRNSATSRKRPRRLTVKIGTRVLTDKGNRIDESALKALSGQFCDLMDEGIQVIVVTSGAIASGLGVTGSLRHGLSLSQLQAMASIGQNRLMDLYSAFFAERGYLSGQILLTQEDFNDRGRFLNISHTLNTLFDYKAIPLINENDSVSTEEIKCGDNDRISALVADLAVSDMLIILSDVEGLLDHSGKVIASVDAIDSDIRAYCRGKSCMESTGGMATKLDAIRSATRAGIECFIANGRAEDVVRSIAHTRSPGTRFLPGTDPISARKRWIAYTKKAKGEVVVDDGAIRAVLELKKSLLPGGITAVNGTFSQGDLVDIADAEGAVVAKGLTNYSSAELRRIKGKKSAEIVDALGYKDRDEVVHRDDLVVVRS